jgi:16S rRNA (uracil1498-N3)-methyltransferase
LIKLRINNLSLARFYTPLQQLKPGIKVYLPEAEAIHMRKALRLQPGDIIEVFNGTEVYRASIYKWYTGTVRVELLERVAIVDTDFPSITLYLALVKLPKLEIAIQKCVELGITHIQMFTSAYGQIDPKQFNYRLPRLKKIVLEACKQSKRSDIPDLLEPINFTALAEAAKAYDKFLFLSTELPGQRFKEVDFTSTKNIGYVIGPEGGFNDGELEIAQQAKWQVVNFSQPYILRTETAAIATLASIQSLL